MLVPETITVTLPGARTGEDTQGNPIYGPDSVTTATIKAFAPNVSDETAGDPGVSVVSGGTVYGYRGTTIPHNAVLTIRGQQWHVNGEVGDFLSPYSGAHPNAKGVQFAVERHT